MRKWLLTAATLGFSAAALGAISATPANAGPFCKTDKDGGPNKDCSFYSMRACQRSTSGIGGSCLPNPYWHEEYSYIGPAEGYGLSYNYYEGPVYGPALSY